jgi:hypothetical protein
LYFAIRNTVFGGLGEDGELSNTAFFPKKYGHDPIYFPVHFVIYGRYMPQPIFNQANSCGKEVGRLKTKKKVSLNELARRQEAKFWAMMRAADPGKRCLK